MFFSKTALISLFALPTLISANGIRCASSIQLPTLGDKVVIDTNTVTGLFSYEMEFKDKACESASIIAQLSSPSLNSLPIGCASTSPSDYSDNSVFTPSTSTTTSPTLYCNLKNSDLVIGEENTLTINVNDEAIIRRSFIVESSASKVKNAKDVLPETTLTTPATRYGLAPISLRCESSYIQCPISRNKKRGGFNWACLPAEELTSCGGCPNLLSGDQSGLSGEDCTEIEGVDETECRERKCVVNSCDTGYALINGRCTPALSPNYQQKPIQYVSNSRSDKKTHYAGRVISIAGRLMANR